MSSIGEKTSQTSMRKRGEKTGDSIDEKPPKLDKEIRRKTDHLFAKFEKPPKPS